MARRTSKKTKSRKSTKSSSSKNVQKPILAGIPPQRRIDILGIILLVVLGGCYVSVVFRKKENVGK